MSLSLPIVTFKTRAIVLRTSPIATMKPTPPDDDSTSHTINTNHSKTGGPDLSSSHFSFQKSSTNIRHTTNNRNRSHADDPGKYQVTTETASSGEGVYTNEMVMKGRNPGMSSIHQPNVTSTSPTLVQNHSKTYAVMRGSLKWGGGDYPGSMGGDRQYDGSWQILGRDP
ncbi:uncharacterized protein BO96DRAFT_431657 [Aspergillus niger CBS 101883]|uniref:uncharacterized protein n=1 Tax=Aspergillus lacticoffeatus (strain CBS 101883) TaxID=1450533 RepID=UPI000D7F1A06|nr:uncharacterized protein BO96DRAFT_431657 [Aspergillus niger CBS 101883]PYH59510.1 hypothetical protein BO96DRAFT_431657 [Aspergillus niger CBS 101883]